MVAATMIPRLLLFLLTTLALQAAQKSPEELQLEQDNEDYIHTPIGFSKPREPSLLQDENAANLVIRVIDKDSGNSTPCRMNVVGPDGMFYQPAPSVLSDYALTGIWPMAKGNRRGMGPFRYFGRFFYSDGQSEVKVPAGVTRVEVWKGFEYRPVTLTLNLEQRETRSVELELERTLDAARFGYFGGDSHIHIERTNAANDELIFTLTKAEDIRYASILCYNQNVSEYEGHPMKQGLPQKFGFGKASLRGQDIYQIMSGQEYRSRFLGHIKVFLLNRIVKQGESFSPDHYIFAERLDSIRKEGGYTIWAHGGYGKEIYANVPFGDVDGVELLQFGNYRGIGLEGWYAMLNTGYRPALVGASDYPPCRKLADCRTYIHHEGRREPRFPEWIEAMGEGRSFVTTGPVLLLEVDGAKPGESLSFNGERTVRIRARVNSEVAPVTRLQILIGGNTLKEIQVPAETGQHAWVELDADVTLNQSTWIAARATGEAPTGSPNAEAHTNPVYIYVNGRAPFVEASHQFLVEQLGAETERQANRKDFPGKDRLVGYFRASLEKLKGLKETGGMTREEALSLIPNSRKN